MFLIAGETNLYAKDESLRAEWGRGDVDNRVRRIVRHLAVELAFLGYDGVITSIFRRKGIHGTGRAVDLRCRHMPVELAEQVRQRINNWFPYDPQRPRYETIPPLDHAGNSSASTADHFHVQVKP